MPTRLIKASLEKIRKDLAAKMTSHGHVPMTEQEKAAFILERRQAEREEVRALLERREELSGERLERLGLREEELALDWPAVKPNLSDGYEAAAAVRQAFERGHGLILLSGGYGQAKTLIGKILVAQALKKGRGAAYANFLEALDNIRQAFDQQENKTSELIRRIEWWTGLDVLFLDEFDKCSDTPWVMERKFQIVDRCYQRAIRQEALTVLASNRTDAELDGYIRSRLNDLRVGPVITLNGPDARKAMPKGWRF